MRETVSFLCGLLAAGVALAAPPAVKFPETKVPAVMPSAAAVTSTVTADRLFVIESKDPVTIIASPDGLVKVTREVGPLTVFAKFADGSDKMERRTFAGPHVFLIEPVKSGECELLVIPEKVLGEADIVRRAVRVDAGERPRPPPKPVDPPQPVEPASPFAGDGLRALIVYEKDDLAKLPAGQLAVLTGGQVRDYLNAKCATSGGVKEWRVFDKDVTVSDDSPTWKRAMARPRKSVPWVVIGNGKTGYEGPLPATVEDTLALLKQYEVK